MKKTVKGRYTSVAVSLTAVLLGIPGSRTPAQGLPTKSATDAPKTAEQQFKSIQVLKGISADEVIPSMQFIQTSLGVECDFCHVEHAMEKDDKKPKLAARKMIEMVMAINKGNFKGELEPVIHATEGRHILWPHRS
jgi:hypothetical protein